MASYGVYDPLSLHHSNDALLFDGREITPDEDDVPADGTVVSQPITMPLTHIGMTLRILSSADGTLSIEEYVTDNHDPNLGFLDGNFIKFEPNIAVDADQADKPDFSRTFKPFRVKFVPTAADPYTLLVEATRKG